MLQQSEIRKFVKLYGNVFELLSFFYSFFLCNAQLLGACCNVQLLHVKLAGGVDSAVSVVETLLDSISNSK